MTAPGNWYTIVGTGNTIVASMCSMPTTYDAKMHVYCGTSCDSLFCLSANDDGCAPAGTSEVTWCSEAGQQYYIFISGFSDGTGPYELSVTSGGGCGETTPCQNNEDICDFALDIAPGQSINVSNASATTDGAVPDCGSGGQNGPGIWLQTIGDGTTFSLQLCNPVPASLNTRLNVYCGAVAGSCSSLDCAVTEPVNNSGCAPFTEKVTWCTELGREYYILVSGAGPASLGSVNVLLSSDLFGCKNFPCAPPLLNDECVGAISITDGSYPLDIGSASDSGPVENSCDFPFGDNDVHQDLWYDYTATCTGTLFVDTCGGFNDDTRLAIYQGCQCPPSSPPLECNDDHGNANEGDTGLPCPGGLEASLSIPVTQGQCYKIRVGAFSTSPGGDDLLNVGCEPAP